MTSSGWEFEEDHWWDSDFIAVKFAGSINGERHVFAVSQCALNDYFRTEDTKEDALENFERYRDRIREVAKEMHRHGLKSEEHGHYFITHQLCKQFNL